jgi:hypothetical protein
MHYLIEPILVIGVVMFSTSDKTLLSTITTNVVSMKSLITNVINLLQQLSTCMRKHSLSHNTWVGPCNLADEAIVGHTHEVLAIWHPEVNLLTGFEMLSVDWLSSCCIQQVPGFGILFVKVDQHSTYNPLVYSMTSTFLLLFSRVTVQNALFLLDLNKSNFVIFNTR